MKFYIRQRFFSWFDSFDITDEAGNLAYTVKGRLDWGHNLHMYNGAGQDVGSVREKIITFLPKFEIYLGNQYYGMIRRELTLFRPKYNIDFNGWNVQGNFLEWDYTVVNQFGQTVAAISKDLFHWTDHYVIDVANPQDAICALLLVIAIDAEKCSRNSANS